MAKEFFKNLPDTSTPLSASRLNGLLNGNEAMGNIVVGDVKSKNLWSKGSTITSERNTNVNLNDYIPSGTYTMSWGTMTTDSETTPLMSFRNASGNSVLELFLPLDKNSITFDLPYAVYMYRFYPSNNYNNSQGKTTVLENVQLEKGTTATEYTPYKAFGIESGSNENGSWIKFEDGTMICRNTFEVQAIISKQASGIWYYDQPTINKLFPQEFVGEYPQISIEIVNAGNGSGDWGQIHMNYIDLAKISSVVFIDAAQSFTAKTYVLSYIAIGRWK